MIRYIFYLIYMIPNFSVFVKRFFKKCKMQNAKCKIDVAFRALIEKHTAIILF